MDAGSLAFSARMPAALLRRKYIPEGNHVLAVAALLLLGLSVAFIVVSGRVVRRGDEVR